MGSFVAITGKNQNGVFDDALTMLSMLAHRGKSSFGIADHEDVIIKETIQGLHGMDIRSNALIGHGFSKTLPRDQAQPVKNHDFCLVFEGRIFPPPSRSESTFVLDDLKHIEQRTSHLIRSYYGSFVVGTVDKNGVQIGSSPIATIPLYYGENRKICAAASEQKALRKIGITDIFPFPAGCVASLTETGFRFTTVKTICQPSVPMGQGVEVDVVATHLENVMLKAAERHFADLAEIAIAFSGGLDSSLVSVLAKHCSLKIMLIWVGLEGQSELNSARQAANALGLPLYTKTYTLADVEKIISHILWLIEDADFVNLTIAIPFYWAAAEAAKLGFKVMATGQGGDELFAGYYRNLKLTNYSGADLNRAILEEVTASLQSNSPRDNKTSAFHGVELRNPFLDWELIHFALNIPFYMKISSPDDPLRKRILRLTGKTLGIPNTITEKPKKAIQYSTGVEKAIRKLARMKRKTPAEYLADIQTRQQRLVGGIG